MNFVRGLVGGFTNLFAVVGAGDTVQAVYDLSSTGTSSGDAPDVALFVGQTIKSEASITTSVTGTAYSVGDAVGGLLTFNGVVRAAGVGGVIKSVKVANALPVAPYLKLFLFHTAPLVSIDDNSEFTLNDGDLSRIEAIIHITTGSWNILPSNAYAEVECSIGIDTVTDDLYGALVHMAGTGMVFTTSGLTVFLNTLSD